MREITILDKLISTCITYKYSIKEIYINEETLEGTAWVVNSKGIEKYMEYHIELKIWKVEKI